MTCPLCFPLFHLLFDASLVLLRGRSRFFTNAPFNFFCCLLCANRPFRGAGAARARGVGIDLRLLLLINQTLSPVLGCPTLGSCLLGRLDGFSYLVLRSQS